MTLTQHNTANLPMDSEPYDMGYLAPPHHEWHHPTLPVLPPGASSCTLCRSGTYLTYLTDFPLCLDLCLYLTLWGTATNESLYEDYHSDDMVQPFPLAHWVSPFVA